MKQKALLLGLVLALLPLGALLLACSDPAAPEDKGPTALQFLPEELALRDQWEDFLRNAEVDESQSYQMKGSEAVTSPWVLTLRLGDVVHKGLWKNPEGRMGGYWEGWAYEIAAYRLDKHLGLGMVPPTVERRFRGNRGSCQYWVDDTFSLKEKESKKLKTPPAKVFSWNRATYLQRLFDNLIANEDRHSNQILITPDWRIILIDHSRSFRTSGKFVRSLIYSARSPTGPMLMSELPRAVVERLRALDRPTIKAVAGDYLTDTEIEAVLTRKDLILEEIARLIEVNGEDKVLY